MNFLKTIVCIALTIGAHKLIPHTVLAISPNIPTQSCEQIAMDVEKTTVVPTVHTANPTKRKQSETSETESLQSPLKKQKLDDKDETAIKNFFTQLFKNKKIENKKVFEPANIYINYNEFLFDRTVVSYNVESNGAIYICRLNRSAPNEIFLMLRPYSLNRNIMSFDIKTAYISNGKSITPLTKRQLIEILIKEFQSTAQKSSAHTYISMEKIKYLQTLINKIDVQSAFLRLKTQPTATLTPVTLKSLFKATKITPESPKIVPTDSKKLLEHLLSKLYVHKKITLKEVLTSSRIYMDEQYLFLRSVFCYEVEDEKPIYVCLLPNGRKKTKYFTTDEYFLLLRPTQIKKSVKHFSFTIVGMCTLENEKIKTLQKNEMYTKLIQEITKNSLSKKSRQTATNRTADTIIKNLSSMQTAEMSPSQKEKTSSQDSLQTQQKSTTEKKVLDTTSRFSSTPIEQLPLCMEVIDRLFPKSTTVIPPRVPASDTTTRTKQRRARRKIKQDPTPTTSIVHTTIIPESSEYMFACLCQVAAEST